MKSKQTKKREIELSEGVMLVIRSESGLSCDCVHLHGDNDLKMKVIETQYEYDDDPKDTRSYVELFLDGVYTCMWYGHYIESIEKRK